MGGAVPVDEVAAERSGMSERVKAIGKARPVLERFELCLGKGIVAGGVRPECVFVTPIREEERDRLGDHGAASIGMHGQFAARDRLLLDALGDDLFRYRHRLPQLHWCSRPRSD